MSLFRKWKQVNEYTLYRSSLTYLSWYPYNLSRGGGATPPYKQLSNGTTPHCRCSRFWCRPTIAVQLVVSSFSFPPLFFPLSRRQQSHASGRLSSLQAKSLQILDGVEVQVLHVVSRQRRRERPAFERRRLLLWFESDEQRLPGGQTAPFQSAGWPPVGQLGRKTHRSRHVFALNRDGWSLSLRVGLDLWTRSNADSLLWNYLLFSLVSEWFQSSRVFPFVPLRRILFQFSSLSKLL